ncbi:MAG: tyrosine-type recombinase/integrase [Akkermansia sp.]|nr:tyrosine-type recombinase/integrase [Akkermansia sp.]
MKKRIQYNDCRSTSLAVSGDVALLVIQLANKWQGGTHFRNKEFFHRLRQLTEAFVRALDETEESVSFRTAAEFSLLSRAHRRPSTRADLRSYINRMCQYGALAECPLREIRIPLCREMLQCCFGHSAHSYRKAQSILHSIFTMGIRQGWCSQNPAKAILRPPVYEQRIEILTLSQIHALLKAMQCSPRLQRLESAFRLMLWCGIRPEEVRRLHWSDIDAEEKLVYVEGRNSKTGGARAVPLRGGACCLLQQDTNTPTSLIAPANWDRLWRRLRQEAGFAHWQNDALRHTFASMHLKHFHNLVQLQEEMGHRNAALLQTRYLNLRGLRCSSAARFFTEQYWL